MELSHQWWARPAAAWALIVFEGTSPLPVPGEAAAIFPTSSSQVYVLPLVLGIAIRIIRALRGLNVRAEWARQATWSTGGDVTRLCRHASSGHQPR